MTTASTQGPGPTRLRVLHVVICAGPTNSQWNEHCLPVADHRRLTVCSLLPATADADPRIERFEGDGSVRGAMTVLRRSLRAHDYDLVHVHDPAAAALLLAACALERRGRRNLVVTVHNSWPNLRPRNRVLTAANALVYPTTVACSRAAAASMPNWLRTLAGRRIQVVPNGVDVARVDRALSGLEGTGPGGSRGLTVVTVGRLIAIKDQATLVRAFARAGHRDDRLVIVGQGPLREELQGLARDLGLGDQVELRGLMPREEVYRLLAAADLFVSPSRGEGLPLSVLEAMAAGLPVVLSDIAPHREIIADARRPATMVRTGVVLVPADDTAATARAIDDLRALGPAGRAAAGARARRHVQEHFSVGSMTRGYDAVYAGLLGRDRPTHPTQEVVA